MNYKFPSLAGGNRHNSQPCVSTKYCSNSFRWFFPWSWVASSNTCAQLYSTGILRGIYRSLDISPVQPFSLSGTLLRFLVALISWFLRHISSMQGLCWALPGFSFPGSWSGNWDSHRAYVISFAFLRAHLIFPSLKNHCLVSSVLKTVVSYISYSTSIFFFLRQEGDSYACYSVLMDVLHLFSLPCKILLVKSCWRLCKHSILSVVQFIVVFFLLFSALQTFYNEYFLL